MPSSTPKKLKVFSGSGFVTNTVHVSLIIAATSRKKAVEALRAHGVRETESHMASHWMVIKNPEAARDAEHYARALEFPEVPLANSRHGADDYAPVPRAE